jgi:hypothetical protein
MTIGLGASIQIRDQIDLEIAYEKHEFDTRDDHQFTLKVLFIWIVVTIALPFLGDDEDDYFY